MSYDYETIKETAKERGFKVTDLLALAPQNDPFYVGTPGDIEMAKWFADIWERAGYSSGVHLRRIHYWTVSQSPAVPMPNGLPYENTEKCWQYLILTSKKARYLGYIEIADISDNKNPQPHVHASYFDEEVGYEIHSPQLDAPHIWVQGIYDTNAQPYHLEVWCEKSTMNDVLLPVCQRYKANLVTFEGEVSITACYQLVERIKASDYKPTRIWYISDFDPAGNSMPVAMSRKVEYILDSQGGHFDVRIRPIALTAAQIQEYRLPRIPIKETEKRAARFEESFGTGAVELDALEALYPRTLGNIVRKAIAPYYSEEAADETREKEAALRQAINEKIAVITAKYQKEIEAVKAMLEEVQQVEVDPYEFEVQKYDPHMEYDEEDDWLFDNGRLYLEQIRHYKAHKGLESDVA